MEKHKCLSNFNYLSLRSDTLFGLLDYDCTHTNGACSLAYVPLVSNKENVAPSLQIVEFISTITRSRKFSNYLCHEENIDF
jgi:hypothetical protein